MTMSHSSLRAAVSLVLFASLAACAQPHAANSGSPSPNRATAQPSASFSESAVAQASTSTSPTAQPAQPTASKSPPARAGAGMAYDELRKVTVLFGGEGSSMLFGDTWTFDGRNWNELHPATSPPARRN